MLLNLRSVRYIRTMHCSRYPLSGLKDSNNAANSESINCLGGVNDLPRLYVHTDALAEVRQRAFVQSV